MSTHSQSSSEDVGNGLLETGGGAGPAKRVRRRAGPFKRSRTGCGTCKRRGKKCDEQWTAEGFCQRCIVGEFECAGKSMGGSSNGARRVDRSKMQGGDNVEVKTEPHVSSPPPLQDGPRVQYSAMPPAPLAAPQPLNHLNTSMPANGMAPLPSPLTTPVTIDPSSTSLPHSHTNTQFAWNPTPLAPPAPAPAVMTPPTHNHSLPHSQPLSNSHSQSHSQAHPQLGHLTHAIHPSQSHSHTNNNSQLQHHPGAAAQFFSSFAQPQPLYNWPANFAHNHNQPSAFLTSNMDGTLAIDPAPFNWGSNTSPGDQWEDFALTFPSPENGSAGGKAGNHQFNSGSRVLFLSGEKPMRQGVSLAEIYARVVESWLVGIPSTTRDYARARILALNDNSSVMRNVRYAVAAAYIFLFASDPQDDSDNPRPKLVELACKGAGMVDGQPGTVSSSGTLDDDEPAAGTKEKRAEKRAKEKETSGGKMSKKIRLYVDHVSTPFAADIESQKWTEDAVRELREVIVTDTTQLSDLLWGVIDLQLVEFIRGGAAPSYSMLALGDRLVRNAMGAAHPPITLSHLRSSDTFSLRLYALSDISRCIVERGRKTIFNFWSDVGDSDANTPNDVEGDEPWATYLGLPDSIVILLAEIVNLCAELKTSSATSIKAQAEELETALRGWQSQTFSTADGIDSAALVSRTIAGELWRLSALILLYQSVHNVGGLHPVLRRAQSDILALLDSVTRLPNGDLFGFIALPAFLAATLSLTEQDRQRAMRHLLRPGPERVWLDNISLVEKLWEEVDQTGVLPDWHDKMTREGVSVAFF
ncbi:hypothetical protein IAT38_006320 [Cryptococcus sp. DSM 104549]